MRRDDDAQILELRDLFGVDRDGMGDHPAQVVDRRLACGRRVELQHLHLDPADAQFFARGGLEQGEELLRRQRAVVVETGPAGARGALRPQPRFERLRFRLGIEAGEAHPVVTFAVAGEAFRMLRHPAGDVVPARPAPAGAEGECCAHRLPVAGSQRAVGIDHFRCDAVAFEHRCRAAGVVELHRPAQRAYAVVGGEMRRGPEQREFRDGLVGVVAHDAGGLAATVEVDPHERRGRCRTAADACEFERRRIGDRHQRQAERPVAPGAADQDWVARGGAVEVMAVGKAPFLEHRL